MNLHDLQPTMLYRYFWITATGRNGHGLGTHLWNIPEGTPPPITEQDNDPNVYRNRYWRPTRFAWRPFISGINTLHLRGWRRPLCGRMSTAERPETVMAYNDERTCAECNIIRLQRNITTYTIHDHSFPSTPVGVSLSTEIAAWNADHR